MTTTNDTPGPPAPDTDAATFDALAQRTSNAYDDFLGNQMHEITYFNACKDLAMFILDHAATIRDALARSERPLAVGDDIAALVTRFRDLEKQVNDYPDEMYRQYGLPQKLKDEYLQVQAALVEYCHAHHITVAAVLRRVASPERAE